MEKDKDVVKEAIAAATTKTLAAGKLLPENVRKALEEQAKEKSQATLKPTKDIRVEEIEVLSKRTEPIWPMDDAQLATWRKEKMERDIKAKAKPKEASDLTPERRAEIRSLAIEHATRKFESRRRATPKEEKVVKEVVVKEKKASTRQNRLGQTKLIDELLKEGKTEKEVFTIVREKIPAYPADKLPKLIKLRQYHVKKK